MTLFRESGPLIHKSWLLFSRNKISRILKLFILPGMLLIASTFIASGIFRSGDSKFLLDPSYKPLNFTSIDSLRNCSDEAGMACSIGVVPSFSMVSGGYGLSDQQALFEAWKPFLELEFGAIPLVYFDNVTELESHYAHNISIFGAIVLDSSWYPEKLTYDVRLPYSILAAPVPYERPSFTIPVASDLIGGAKTFVESGFNQLQMAVDTSLANLLVGFSNHSLTSLRDGPSMGSKRSTLTNASLSLSASVSRGPHSEFSVASSLASIPLTLFFSYFSIAGLFSSEMAAEKQSRMKEYLHAMGLSARAYWFVHSVLMLAAVTPVVCAQIGGTFWSGLWGPNLWYGALFIVLFALCTVAYTMMCAALSDTIKAASLWDVLYFVPPMMFGQTALSAPYGIRVALCLFAPFNLMFAVMSSAKDSIIAVTGPTSRLPAAIEVIPHMPTSISISFFFLDLMLYISIGILVRWRKNRRIPPLTAGNIEMVLESHLFLAHQGKGAINSGSDIISEAEDAIEMGEHRSDHFEPKDDQDPSSIRISTKNVSLHTNNKQEPELAPLDLRIDDGIFAIVGGHSCGKSALLSIISGFDLPTTGYVEIEGVGLYENRDFATSNLSVCPTSNHFVTQMTGREHLTFILSLRQGDLDNFSMMERVNEIISEMQLDLFADEPIETYSTGALRSLMVASALITPATIIILDEASTGMNLEQKQVMWRAIMRRRQFDGTTFIVATQCLSEAETIADRIAIMVKGQLLREGSIEFLTRKQGFQLHLKESEANHDKEGRSVGVESLEIVPLSMKETLPIQIKKLEEIHGSGSISITSPSLQQLLADLEASLDNSTDEDVIQDSVIDGSGSFEGLNMTSFPQSPLYRRPLPKRANTLQQTVQFLKRTVPVGLRLVGPNISFFLVPLVLITLGLAMARVPGHSLHNMPQLIHGLRPHSTDPVLLGIGQDLPIRIPTVSDSLWSSSMLSPWTSDGRFSFPSFKDPKAMYKYLWKAENPTLLDEGGIELNVDLPTQISYNIAFNMSEVYSTVNLINMVNNMAIRLFLLENANLTLPANIASPFLQVRSTPLHPRDNFGLKRDSDTKIIDKIVTTVLETEVSFPGQASVGMAILGMFLARQLLLERDRGILAQLRRSGLRLVSYWLGTMIWATVRLLGCVFLVLSVTAIFKVSFIVHAPMGWYFLSLLLMACTVLPLVAVLIHKFTLETAEGVVVPLIVMVLGPELIEKNLAPGLIRSQAAFLGHMLANIHYLSPLGLFPAFVKNMALAYTDEGFTTPSTGVLLSFDYCGGVLLAQFLHFILWYALFWVLEFRGRTVAQFPGDETMAERAEIEFGSMDPNRDLASSVPMFVPSAGLQHLKPADSQYHASKTKLSISGGYGTSPDLAMGSNGMDLQGVLLDEEDGLVSSIAPGATVYRVAAIKTENLVKRWNGMPRRAIPPLNLSIPIGHSYALVGPKSSGKTTILSLLLGDEASTSGSLEFYGNPAVGMNRNHLYGMARFGACLQRDALFENMTVKEHIELYLSLRNDLYEIDVSSATRFILSKARLMRFADTYAGVLEKGQKQKLNLALAALTFTETLILDEPTRGCDSASRQTIWELLRYIHTEQNTTLLISTPSLEEGLATCGNVGILINGEIVSASSLTEIHRACSGFELRIWILNNDGDEVNAVDKLQAVMKNGEALSNAKLIDSHVSRNLSICATYDLSNSIALSSAIEFLNGELQNGLVIDYHITSITPELAFQRASQYQADDYSRHPKSRGGSCTSVTKAVRRKCCK